MLEENSFQSLHSDCLANNIREKSSIQLHNNSFRKKSFRQKSPKDGSISIFNETKVHIEYQNELI